MDAEIYRHEPGKAEKLVGRIGEDGDIVDIEVEGEEHYIGRVDYQFGDIYDQYDELIGWVEENGDVVAYYDEQEEYPGYISKDGEIFCYDDEGEEIYLGRVKGMQNVVEGAAALLLFFEFD